MDDADGDQTHGSTLPEQARTALTSAYRDYAEAPVRSAEQRQRAEVLAELAAAARTAGWPMRLLAEPCGVSAERLRQISAAHSGQVSDDVAALFPDYQRPRPARRRPPKRPHLTVEQAHELRELARPASQNTGSHAPGSQARRASEAFTALIRQHHERGVIWAELSDATRPWTRWPIPEEQAQLPPLVRVSGLRQRVSRAASQP